MADLKPCPFCGGNLLSFTQDGTATIVLCGDCSGMGPLGMDEETAALAWNMRGGVGLEAALAARGNAGVAGVSRDEPQKGNSDAV